MAPTDQSTSPKAKEDVAAQHVEEAANHNDGGAKSDAVQTQVAAALTADNGAILNNATSLRIFTTNLEQTGILPAFSLRQLETGRLDAWKDGDQLSVKKIEEAAKGTGSPTERALAQALLDRLARINTDGDTAHISQGELAAWVSKPILDKRGALVTHNEFGKPTEIENPPGSGRKTTFTYNERGELTSFVPPETSGSAGVKFADGKWQWTGDNHPAGDIAGVSLLNDGSVKIDMVPNSGPRRPGDEAFSPPSLIMHPDGVYTLPNPNKPVEVSAPGAVTQPVDTKPVDTLVQPIDYSKPGSVVAPPSREILTTDAVDDLAAQMNKAANQTTALFFSNPDSEGVITVLESLSAADRQRVAQSYERQFKVPLEKDMVAKLGAVNGARVEALMRRWDGKSDEAGQIHVALARLNTLREGGDWNPNGVPAGDARVRIEKDIRDTLAALPPNELAYQLAKYKQNYGTDLLEDLKSNPNLSDATKKTLDILTKGAGKLSTDDYRQLAELGLATKRPDIFEMAMRDGPEALRTEMKANGVDKRIEDQFYWNGSLEIQIAKDYVNLGTVSLATLVNGDNHWWHTNRDEIARVMTNASPDEVKRFMDGRDLFNSGAKPAAGTPEDKALQFYTKLHEALTSAGDKREAALWEAQLTRSENVTQQLLQAYDSGYIFGLIGSGVNRNRLFGAVEGLSEEDFNRLRANPQDLKQIDTALATFVGKEDREQVMAMLNAKLHLDDPRWTYAQSRTEGRRSLEDIFAQNSNWGDRTQNVARLDALMYMTPAERTRLQNDPEYLKKVQGMVAESFFYADRMLADRLIARAIDKSADLTKLPPVEAALYLSAKNENPLAVVNAMEQAFSDPAFRERMNKPQTEEDKKLALYLHDAVVRAGFLANGIHDYHSNLMMFRQGRENENWPEEARGALDHQIFDGGKVSLDQKVFLAPDKATKFDLVASASPEDRQRLLQQNPDQATKEFQDAVLGTDPQIRQLLLNGARQGNFDQADMFRAYVLDGSSRSYAQLKEDLQKMTPEQRGDLANIYYTKFGTFIGSEVTNKAPANERWQVRELFAPYEQNLRQVALDGRTNLYNNTSSWDGFLKDWWDSTAVARDASADAMSKFMVQNADAIAALPKEQQEQFRKLVDNYNAAVDAYVKSKGAAAEVLVDATITLAAFGGAVFTGGASLGLIGALSFGGGAIYRTAMMASIQGTNFDASTGNLFKQGFKGGVTAFLMMLGPAQLGIKGMSVGAEVATATAGAIVAKDAAGAVFKEGAEKVIATGLASLSRTSVVGGGKEFQAQIAQIAEQAINPALTGAQRDAALKQAQQFISQQLQQDVVRGLTNRVRNETELYLQNLAAAELGNAGGEFATTAAGVESPASLFERLQGGVTSTIAGVTFFHGLFRTGGAAVTASLGRTKEGDLLAGPGTNVKHADGKQEVVPDGQTLKLQPTDLIVEAPSAKPQPPYDTIWGKAQLDENGQLIHFETPLGGYTRLDATTWVRDETGVKYRASTASIDADGNLQYTFARYTVTFDGKTGRHTIKTPAGKEVTSFRHSWGDRDVAVEYGADGNPNVYHFPGMKLALNKDGIWVNEKGEAIAKKVTFNEQTSTAEIEMADAYVKKTGIIRLTRTANGESQVTWAHNPEIPDQPIHTDTVDANFQARVIRGDVEPQRDGTFVAADTTGNAVIYDAHGTPIGARNSQGQDIVYKRAADGRLTEDGYPAAESIAYSRDGKLEYTLQKKDGQYARVYPDGRTEPLTVDGKPVTELYVTSDGAVVQRAAYDKTIELSDLSERPGRAWVEEKIYPDGTRVKLDEFARESVGADARQIQRDRLEHLKDTVFQNDEFSQQRKSRFWDMVKKFEQTAKERGTSDEEIANVYYQLNKLLSADESLLPLATRRTLSEQLMLGLSHPEMTDQGFWKSCNVTAGQQVPLMVKSPSAVADLVTQVAITGKYITKDGHIIDMTAARGTLVEQADTIIGKPFNGDRRDFSDIDNYEQGSRNFFDQIVQTTMVNIHWQTRTVAQGEPGTFRPAMTVDQVRSGVPYQPADLRYEIWTNPNPDPKNPQATANVREQVTSYRRNPPEGILKPDEKGGKWVDPLTSGEAPLLRPTESPDLSDWDIIGISQHIIGATDKGAYISKSSLGRNSGTDVATPEALAAHLQMLQEQHRLPATVFVYPRHVVNVHAIKESPPGSGKFFVQETNQYGQRSDHWDGNLPLEELWKMMGPN